MGRNGTIDTVGRVRMSFMEYALRTKSRGDNLAPGRNNKRFSIQIWHAAFFLYINGYDLSIRSPMSSTRHQNHHSYRTPQAQIAVNLWTCHRITSQKKTFRQRMVISDLEYDTELCWFDCSAREVQRIRLCLVWIRSLLNHFGRHRGRYGHTHYVNNPPIAFFECWQLRQIHTCVEFYMNRPSRRRFWLGDAVSIQETTALLLKRCLRYFLNGLLLSFTEGRVGMGKKFSMES